MFANLRAAAAEMQKAIEQAVEQMTSFQQAATGGGTEGATPTKAAAKKATGATKASKASSSKSS